MLIVKWYDAEILDTESNWFFARMVKASRSGVKVKLIKIRQVVQWAFNYYNFVLSKSLF